MQKLSQELVHLNQKKKNLQQRKIVDELSAKFNKTLSEYAASEKVLHQLATSYVNTHETWNYLNPPNTIPNTWDEMNQVCKDKGKRLCNQKELCISNQPITSLNTFGGTDNWVAVNDKQNEWLTYATFDNRLCKTATQVAGGVPAWGTTKTPDGWFRAAKCCTNINASESLAQQQSIVKTKARHLDNVAKEVYTALNAMITEEHNIDEQLLKEMRKLRKDTAIYDKTIQKSTDMNITNPTTSAMETTSSLEMSSNSVKYLLWSGLAGLGVLAALKAAY